MRFLTPTDNKRLNELIGFLCIVLAILSGLALLTYQPSDISLNVSGPASGSVARNWIGPVRSNAGIDATLQLVSITSSASA